MENLRNNLFFPSHQKIQAKNALKNDKTLKNSLSEKYCDLMKILPKERERSKRERSRVLRSEVDETIGYR